MSNLARLSLLPRIDYHLEETIKRCLRVSKHNLNRMPTRHRQMSMSIATKLKNTFKSSLKRHQ